MKIFIFIVSIIIFCIIIYEFIKLFQKKKEQFTNTVCPITTKCPDCKQQIDCQGSFTPERCLEDCGNQVFKITRYAKTIK